MTTLPPSANTARTHPENRAFYPALDGLRAVAFLSVFCGHYLRMPWGWTGVNVFFVLSGFLITGILFDSRDQPHRARIFYIRRTLRIFPLYYGLFAGLLLLQPLMHWHWNRFWLLWPLYLGNFLRFLSPSVLQPLSPLALAADGHLGSALFPRSELYLGHLWSLCVEEQFYLLWPWVVFWVRDRRRLLWICGAAVVLGPILRLGLQAHAAPWRVQAELLYRFTPAQLDALLLGGLLALLWRGAARDRLVAVARLAASAGTAILLWYVVFVMHGSHAQPWHDPSWRFTFGLLFVDLYSGAVLVCALHPGGLVYRLLKVNPLRWIGRLSYGAYVFHDLLHGLYVHLVVHADPAYFAAHPDQRSIASALLALLCTLLLAWLSFRLYETPFLNLKNRWP